MFCVIDDDSEPERIRTRTSMNFRYTCSPSVEEIEGASKWDQKENWEGTIVFAEPKRRSTCAIIQPKWNNQHSIP